MSSDIVIPQDFVLNMRLSNSLGNAGIVMVDGLLNVMNNDNTKA